MWREEKPRMKADAAVVAGVVALLRDPAALTRRYALTVLCELAEEPSPETTEAALPGYAVFPELILRDEKESVRELAADTLGAVAAAQEVAFGAAFPAGEADRLALLAALAARGSAVSGLVAGGGALLLRGDLSPAVRAAAVELLGGYHAHARPLAPLIALQLGRHQEPEVVTAARKAMERILGQV